MRENNALRKRVNLTKYEMELAKVQGPITMSTIMESQ